MSCSKSIKTIRLLKETILFNINCVRKKRGKKADGDVLLKSMQNDLKRDAYRSAIRTLKRFKSVAEPLEQEDEAILKTVKDQIRQLEKLSRLRGKINWTQWTFLVDLVRLFVAFVATVTGHPPSCHLRDRKVYINVQFARIS